MPQNHELFSTLNQVKYLYLNQISEPRDNSVRIVVDEATDVPMNAGEKKSMVDLHPEIAKIARGARAIKSTNECRRFELLWDRYIAYLVTEEAAGSMGHYEDEISEGGLFSVFRKSHFLDHLSRDTGGHTKPILHFKITCLNHLIDVASYEPPEIRLLGNVSKDQRKQIKPN